jgi:hypothetical protein
MTRRASPSSSDIGAPALMPNRGLLLQRKCACGAGAFGLAGDCADCRKNKMAGPQARLRISDSDDTNEQEADRVAEQISAMPSRPDAGGAPPRIQHVPEHSRGQIEAPPSVDDVLASSGQPLEPMLRRDMEQRFGHDLSTVRVHSGRAAAQSARDVMARAYTVDNDIVFGEGQYRPATNSGPRLIAHELTHVIQSVGAVGRAVASPLRGALMREPEAKDKAEQSKKGPDTDPCTAPDPQLPVYKDAEQKQRDDILQKMLRGLTTDEKNTLCTRFRRALGAFSTSQMETMKSAGVRFWRAGEFPPPFKDEYAPSKKGRNEMARYQPEYRIIQWQQAAGVDEIRHELAHAWDHVRGGKVARLDDYKGDKLRKAVLTSPTFSSESAEKRLTLEEVAEGKKQKIGLSIKDTYDRFMNRPATQSFANSKTAPEHVMSNVREFYAEGYSVFHGDNEDAQAELLCAAPELYQLLEKEAKEEKLAVPNRSKLAENNQANNRKCA